jgi:toxin ParE1/3/4
MARVLWTNAGLTWLHGLCDSLAEQSPERAVEVRERILAAARHLEHSPLMGRVVPEYEREDLRELIVKPFRLLYKVSGEDCLLVGVFHSKQNLTAHFFPDDLEE